jgi:hypothetical protein
MPNSADLALFRSSPSQPLRVAKQKQCHVLTAVPLSCAGQLAAAPLTAFTFARAGLTACPDLSRFAGLRALGLGHNSLGDAGAAAVLQMVADCPLEVLGLRANGLTVLEASAVGKLTKLKTLWLARNALGSTGVTELLKGLPASLRVLSLGRNQIEALPLCAEGGARVHGPHCPPPPTPLWFVYHGPHQAAH